MAEPVRVTSEIGRLRRVLVHSPGPELLAVTPSNRREYLYNDIIDLEQARREHARFVSILAQFCEVLHVQDLLREVLQLPEARRFLLARSEEVTANRSLQANLAEVSTDVLAHRYIEGWRVQAGPFSERLAKRSFVLPPLPNLFFARDAAMIVGNSALISSMRFTTRWPEEVLMRTIFGFHPKFEGTWILYDGSDERRTHYSLEGGDVHPLSPEVVMVGVSPRTNVALVDEVTDLLLAHTDVTDVIVVVLPEHGSAIHLDMVWTQVDRDLCVIYPPAFLGPGRYPVLHRRRGRTSVSEPASLFDALRDVGLPMEPIFCGGARAEAQEREQWTSGCNFLTLAPGCVLSYARNEETLRSLERAGFRLVEGGALVSGSARVGDAERCVITFAGAELVRGGGGPRCMTAPVWRDDVA